MKGDYDRWHRYRKGGIHVAGVDAAGHTVLRKRVRREQLMELVAGYKRV